MSGISNLNRMSGLMSGLDTEALVKAMVANTKARIDSQKQKLQILQWKQEGYRSAISKISDFKGKYLDILSPTSIKAQSVMNKYVASSSNDKLINATAATGAASGRYTIQSASTAKAATVSSNGSVSAGRIYLDFSDNVYGKDYTVQITLDGATKDITFKGGANLTESKYNFLTAANEAFSSAKNDNQKFRFDGNALSFDNKDDGIMHTFSVGYNPEGVGLTSTAYSQLSTSSTLWDVAFKEELEITEDGKYNININGVDFEFDWDTKISEMMNTINNSKAGVKMSFSNISQSFTLETTSTGASSEIKMYQTHGNLLNSLFNIESSQLGATKADKGVLEYVGNGSVSAKIDSDLASKLKTGFGEGSEEGEEDAESINNKYTLTLTVNGESKDITLELDLSGLEKNEDGEYDDKVISEYLSEAIRNAYNDGAEEGSELPQDVSISYAGGKLTVSSSSTTVSLVSEDMGISEEITTEQTLRANRSYLVAPGVTEMNFVLNGKEVTVTASNKESGITLGDLVNVGVITMQSDGTIIAKGDLSSNDAASSEVLNKIFGKDSGIIGARDGDVYTTYGSNSKITISSDDGKTFTTYTSASNLFTFDGTTIDVSKAGNFVADPENGVDYITIDVSKDTSGIMDVIKGFVNDYNTLISDLYGETSTSRPKSNGDYYDPLTDDMEEEMSDKEIEKWNEQAKIGWLYNDSNIQKFISSIRSAMNTYVDGFGLRDLGITLTDNWRDNGKLEIDESKLESAINAYGDKVAELFTGSNGLAAKLENVVESAISTKTKNYGYLSSLAGIDGTKTDKDNQIYKEMASIQKVIDRLNDKYEREQERYWKKFTALEQYMAMMQSQMSYFTDMGNGSGSSY